MDGSHPGPLRPATPEHIAEAGRLLRAGGLVAFPTETVYGLGADALNPDAVERIFETKGRPADNPLIVHVADPDDIGRVAAKVPPLAARLVARHWPGPLTIVLEARPDLPRPVTAGLGTVAVRMPDHDIALALLRAAGVAVAAPSANRSGRPSPTTAAHVLADLGAAVDLVLDGGACELGVESTVVDVRGEEPVVLREGAVTREDLGVVADATPRSLLASSPGTRHRHYTPSCDVRIAPPGEGRRVAAELAGSERAVGLVASEPPPLGVVEVGRFADTAELAAGLYGFLRRAEEEGVDVLVVEAVEERELGRAVMDRLRRAAEGNGQVQR